MVYYHRYEGSHLGATICLKCLNVVSIVCFKLIFISFSVEKSLNVGCLAISKEPLNYDKHNNVM